MSEIIAKAEAPKIIKLGIMLFIARLILPQDSYNKFLYNQATKIDKDAFPYYVGTLIECLKLTKNKSIKYKNSDNESQVITSQMQLFRPYYHSLYLVVKQHRIKNGLNI